jgi:hypothetical protein
MPLSPGDHIAHYEILGVLGRGGMGEVYRARDARLDREVAIKVLSPQFSRDPDRLARFEREAKVLAALNHPNIATIYGREDLAIVMELVEGDTLADRLKSGALPLEETIAIAQQIIAALEAAHDKGVVHRDLKPANIKAPVDGPTKVLDFGLATAIQAGSRDPAENGSESPTLTMGATAAGTIMGTAAYMSPEQAAGKPVDKRADIWSFGVVLWEMLTGQRLFTGESVSHILADVLRAPIEFEKIPAGPLRQLLQRCLDRDVKTRLRDIGEARIALTRASQPEPAPPPPAPVEAKKPFVWIAATAAMTAIAAVGLWGWLKPTPAEPRPITHFVTAALQGIAGNPVAVSPDGSRVAWASASLEHIYLRTMDDPLARPIPGTEGGRFPIFSPDGQWLAFYAGAGPFQLKKIPLAGGAPLTIASGLPTATPMSWGEDGNFLLPGPSISRIPDSGGQPVLIGKADPAKGEIQFVAPRLLPGGSHILTGLLTAKGGINELPVIAVDAKTGERRVLVESGGEARFVPSGSEPGIGHLVYAHNGSLFAAALDAGTLKVGRAVPVLEGLRNLGGLMPAGFSHSGTVAYPGGTGSTALGNPATLTWVDRQGTEQPVSTAVRSYASPRVSPDGGRVAFDVLEVGQTIGRHLWLLDLMRGTTSRLTFDRANGSSVWTPDSRRVIYTSAPDVVGARGALAYVPADGSGQPVTLIEEGTARPTPTSVSVDGKFVIGSTGNDVWVLPLGGDPKTATPQTFLDNRFTRAEFQFSPDGKWVAYQSNESGSNEVYVSPFPGPGGKSQVSTDGGTQPRWNRNGRELFFRSGAKMMTVDTEFAPAFRAGTPKMLFEKVSSDYDVHPDGKRFLMLKPAAAATDNSELHIILNWFDDLRKRVPLQ